MKHPYVSENTGHTETNWQFTVSSLTVPLWSRSMFMQRYYILQDIIYWPTVNPEVKDFISNCIGCNNYLQNNSKAPLISNPNSWQNLIAMNIMTAFIRNYLIRVDFWSDFCKLGTLPNNPAASSMIWCCKINFSQHGMPDVVADTALQFDSKDFE